MITPFDLLSIETLSYTPHLETAGEICINEVRKGQLTAFAFIDIDNPDEKIPLLKRFLGNRKALKVANLKRLSAAQGVLILDVPQLPVAACQSASDFSKIIPATTCELKELTYKGAALGMGVASSLIFHTKDPDPDLLELRGLLRGYLKAAALVYELACLLICRYHPKSVLVFNGRFACCKPIVEAAKRLQVKCLFHERGATLERYEIFDKPVHDFSYIRERIQKAWEQAPSNREDVGRAFFLRRRDGDGIGWVSFSDAQKRGRHPHRKALRRLVYFSSSDDEFAAVGDLVHHRLFRSQKHAIAFLIEWISSQKDTELVIRVHPHLQQKSIRERNWWNGLEGMNVTLVPAESEVDSYALAESADMVLTYGSTMGVESAVLEKPVILLGDSVYSGLGCVYEPKTLDDLQAMLSSSILLPPLPAQKCLPFGYYFLTYGRLYQFYQPTTLMEGKFLGVDLSQKQGFISDCKQFLT